MRCVAGAGPADDRLRGAVLLKARQWYRTIRNELKNLDGVVELLDGTRWLWDYIVHARAHGATLSVFAVDAKRLKCDWRTRHFAELRRGRKKIPALIGGAQGYLVTHICAADDTVVHDFITFEDSPAAFYTRFGQPRASKRMQASKRMH